MSLLKARAIAANACSSEGGIISLTRASSNSTAEAGSSVDNLPRRGASLEIPGAFAPKPRLQVIARKTRSPLR
jgi:hypothetical protein